MSKRIYRIENGEESELAEREPGKRYACTTRGLRELSPAEEARRNAEEQADAARRAALGGSAGAPSVQERLASLEAALAALQGGE